MCVCVCVSRLQHHESSRGQRESAVHQWAALSRSGCGKPWRGAGTGHTTPDRCTAQPQALPAPAHTHTPPAAHAHTPPAGGSHSSQRRRRVLNLKPHPQSSPLMPLHSAACLHPPLPLWALKPDAVPSRESKGRKGTGPRPPGEILCDEQSLFNLNSWSWTYLLLMVWRHRFALV